MDPKVSGRAREIVNDVMESKFYNSLTLRNNYIFVQRTETLILSHILFIIKEKGYVLVNSSNPLWCCKFAMSDPSKDCCYASCNECYCAAGSSQKGRKRPKRGKDVNNNQEGCENGSNHKLTELIQFTDSTYFETTYLKERLDTGDMVPEKCACCHRKLTNKLCTLYNEEITQLAEV